MGFFYIGSANHNQGGSGESIGEVHQQATLFTGETLGLFHKVAIGVEGVGHLITKHRIDVEVRVISELRKVHKRQGVGLALNVGNASFKAVVVLNLHGEFLTFISVGVFKVSEVCFPQPCDYIILWVLYHNTDFAILKAYL